MMNISVNSKAFHFTPPPPYFRIINNMSVLNEFEGRSEDVLLNFLHKR